MSIFIKRPVQAKMKLDKAAPPLYKTVANFLCFFRFYNLNPGDVSAAEEDCETYITMLANEVRQIETPDCPILSWRFTMNCSVRPFSSFH